MSSQAFDLQVFEGTIGSAPKFKIKLPAVPRQGEIITLPDGHYVLKEVYWLTNEPVDPGKGYEWPDSVYYTIRLLVEKKVFTD